MTSPRVTVALVWILGSFAAIIYSQRQNIPPAIAIPVAAAFLLELSCYSLLGRVRWSAPLLWASAVAPYLVYSLPTGTFSVRSLLLIVLLSGVAVYWLRLTPPNAPGDLLFLLALTAVYLSRILQDSYAEPLADLKVGALGQLMAFRLAITAVVEHRPHPDLGFGFLPTRRDWRIGARWFLYFLPVALVLGYAVNFGRLRLLEGFWWKVPGYFLGTLWVVALLEECLFRGFLLRRLQQHLPLTAALALSSVLFGVTHLWFRPYPNWKFVVMASAAGLFYGWAYMEARSIRAAMVSHAMVVAAWRAFVGS